MNIWQIGRTDTNVITSHTCSEQEDERTHHSHADIEASIF